LHNRRLGGTKLAGTARGNITEEARNHTFEAGCTPQLAQAHKAFPNGVRFDKLLIGSEGLLRPFKRAPRSKE
jgi:hypothetical protein